MTMDLLASARQAAENREFAQLDDLWTEVMLDGRALLQDYFEIARTLKRQHEKERAFMLLDMLGQHFESEECLKEAIDVYKEALHYTKDDERIRQKIIHLYRLQYKESEHLEDYLELSSLNRGNSILKSTEKLDEFLLFDIGRLFYFERYGLGTVVDVKPANDEIIVDFELKKKHFLTLSVARGLLMPVTSDHFLYYKYKDIAHLQQMAKDDPIGLIVLLLKSFRTPLSGVHIKKYLEDIVGKQNVGRFWEKTLKQLRKVPNIRTSGTSTKTYEYIAADIDQEAIAIKEFVTSSDLRKYTLAEEYAYSMPQLFTKLAPRLVVLGNSLVKKKPALALDLLLLCQNHDITEGFKYSVDSFLQMDNLLAIINDLRSPVHQQEMLQRIKTAYATDYPVMFRELMLTAHDPRLLDAAAAHLQHVPDMLSDLHRTIFALPKNHPTQYQWMLKKIQEGSLNEYFSPVHVPKILDSLNYVKGIRATVIKILQLDRFDAMIAGAAESDVSRILGAINGNPVLEDYKKQELARIIEYHFPGLFPREDDAVYTTAASLKKKEEELNHLLTVVIPENKKEIGRAREFGDLSENFEYKSAKERQAQLFEKVRTLKAALGKATLIRSEDVNCDQVGVGTRVILAGIEDNARLEYTILGRWDSNPEKNIISNEAPLAFSLIGKKPGDQVQINDIIYRVVEIQKAV